ncbi:MAG: FAD-binding protein [Thermoplasmatota archaeon]
MPVEVDAENLSVSSTAGTIWSELERAARERGFIVPVQPLSERVTVGEWLMGDLPSRGALRHGPPASAVRWMELETGAGAVISAGYRAVSDFASSINLRGLLAGSRGELAQLRRAAFRLSPLGELRAIHYEVPVHNLMEMVEGVMRSCAALYHIELRAEGGEAALNVVLEGPGGLCSLAEKRLEELSARAGARRAEGGELYGSAGGSGEWRVPMPLLKEQLGVLAKAGDVAGVVEGALARIKASPPDELERKWAERGIRGLRTDDWGEAGLGLSAHLKRAFDPRGRLRGGGGLAEAARRLGEGRSKGSLGLRPGMSEAERAELRELMGELNVSFDSHERLLCSHDLAPLPREVGLVFKRVPDAVVLVRSAEDVVRLVRFCVAHGVPLVPRGGASWGFGGCVPTQGGIVADMSFMMGMELREEEGLAVCEPGATWQQLLRAAGKKGLTLGAYPGSAPVATVAGWLSTNGAGLRSYGFGMASDQVAWVEAVLADGSVVSTRDAPLPLTALFAGAEGTLGVITRVAVRLRPAPEVERPLAYAAPSLEALAGPLEALTRSPLRPAHISLFDGAHFGYLRLLGKRAPKVGAMILVLLEGTREGAAEEERLLDALMGEKGAQRLPDEVAEHEWSERFYELRARRLGPGGVLGEAVIPVRALGSVAREVARAAEELGMLCAINGVVVDRNTIALMPYFLTDERTMLRSLGGAMGFVKRVVDIGIAHGGRPSGLGTFFAGNMAKLHDPATAKLISGIKRALDPADVVNPGKHTELGTRYGVSLPPSLVDYGMALMAVLKMGMPDRLPSGGELEERLRGARE